MKKQIIYGFLFIGWIFVSAAYGQGTNVYADTSKVSGLFRSHENLSVRLNMSIKEVKKETNDSTFILSDISYLENDGTWHTLNTEVRARGNYRRNNCYFPPLKIKTNKSERKETIFKDDKKLKLVLPCQNFKGSNDYVVKEYLAYRLYEIISPYHFKTRMLDIEFQEEKGGKTKTHNLKGIFIEDIDEVADRIDGRVVDRPIHPFSQGALASVQNAFFQFMIGNTDFSTSAQHNEKLVYVNKEFVPVPYDFDMSGLVNTNYSVVSVINGEQLPINSVEERLYRGFKRDPVIIYQVRKQFLDNREGFFEILESIRTKFEDPKSYEESHEYLTQFFELLSDDKKFDQAIMQQLRTR